MGHGILQDTVDKTAVDILLECFLVLIIFVIVYHLFFCLIQEIDEMLAGGLTQQDEDDVLNELDSIMNVSYSIPSFTMGHRTLTSSFY